MRSWLMPLAACAVSLAAGWFAGRAFQRAPLVEMIEAHARSAAIGQLLDVDQRKAVAGVYSDPQRAARELGGYVWEPPWAPAPFLGAMPAPGEHGNLKIGWPGFRTTHDLREKKPAKTFRVYLVGGSTAFGVAAPSDDATVGAFLERKLAAELSPATGFAYQVVTAAAPAWTSTHERVLVENLLVEMEPDLVIALSGVNDCHWGLRGFRATWMWTYPDQFFRALLASAVEIAGTEPMQEVVEASKQTIEPERVAERFERNARLAAFALSIRRVPYVVCLQPCLASAKDDGSGPLDDAEQQYFVDCYRKIAQGLSGVADPGLRFADLSNVFDEAYRREQLFIDSYHFGDKGNERLAAAIFDAVRDLCAPK